MNRAHVAGGDAMAESFNREGSAIIPAGGSIDRIVEAKAGQTISWQYAIGKSDEASQSGGFFSRLAGKFASSDVLFGVTAIWTDRQPSDIKLVHAKVRSAGVDDGNVVEFWVEGQPVEYTAGEGVNLVAVDQTTKKLISGQAFDMSDDADKHNREILAAIQALPIGTFVLVGVKGTGAEELSDDVWDALQSCGSTLNGGGHWHKGYALVGVKGGTACQEFRGGDVSAETFLPTELMDVDLTPFQEVTMESGEQKGSFKLDRSGMVILKWSNAHATLAKKKLESYSISCE
jgi:hypothetical protein